MGRARVLVKWVAKRGGDARGKTGVKLGGAARGEHAHAVWFLFPLHSYFLLLHSMLLRIVDL